MELIASLIVVPVVAALLLLVIKNDRARDVIAIAFAALIAVLSIAFAVVFMGSGPVDYRVTPNLESLLSFASLVIDLVVAAFIVCYAVRYKRPLALGLSIVQILFALWIELFALRTKPLFSGSDLTTAVHVDALGVIMVLVIGIVGSGICVYALGYMKDFQAHELHENPQAKDRRPWFFALMFAFLSAMYIIVLADNMTWMYTAWEVTTLCSFLLIGFTKTEEAINNAFRQIVMNMLGGIAFQVAIIVLAAFRVPLMFTSFIQLGTSQSYLVLLPTVLLAFAGMTKAAQMPFHTWLLGAMVAPTPTSALLHSSTMVKAGVFLLVKLSPVFAVSLVPSVMVMLVGGLTFLFCSLLAISQSNAKRVLAYSTIANLGLITACAGVGTPEAVWAAILLIIFHAVAKSLLFLCVGTAEHHIGSRNIEDMDLLFERMPRLARFMMLGIMCMFVAPFGMLIAKWATLVSFVETGNVALIILLAFGSAATFMFWAKWLGKLSGIAGEPQNVELSVHKSEWAALLLMAGLVCVTCVLLPVMSSGLVVPYIQTAFNYGGQDISDGNLWIAAICAALVILMLFAGLGRSSKQKKVDVYLAGASADNSARTFRGSMSQPVEATSRNLYLDGIFGEAKIASVSSAICTLVMVAGIALGLAWLVIVFMNLL